MDCVFVWRWGGGGGRGGDKSTNCWPCLKKGLLEKTVKWWQENILDQSQKKKKKIRSNQVCSSEKTPITPVGGSHRNCPVFLSRKWNIMWAPGITRTSRGKSHGMPGDTVMSYFEKTKPNKIIKTNLSFSFSGSPCLLKIASVYWKQPPNVPSDNRSCWFSVCLQEAAATLQKDAGKRRLRKFSFPLTGLLAKHARWLSLPSGPSRGS